MDINEYQSRAAEFAVYREHMRDAQERLTYTTFGVVGESGEFADKMKKRLRGLSQGIEPTKRQTELLVSELGDVLWYIAAVAGELGLSLEDVAAFNLHKLENRVDLFTTDTDNPDR